MKKTFLGILVAGISVLSASDFKGVIENIDSAKKTITVNDMVIRVMPYTKIEQDACGMGWDKAKKFVDLKKGDFVKVDLIHHNAAPVAEEIEIKCMDHRAY
ncbi:DUF5666 domain-containing protein [Helicobacter baculiformis]|uniref:DUF5666 domain-containing protein n=1 Tax=Helicobacter baculiformis TaxID=427351 RepID=A0ABV7ZHL2_9HELI|nr:DUF5666 domain-containing protein [Helicobacter baculiformis]